MRLAAPFCRVVVLTPGARVDLALPTDVPVAELVAMLTERLAGPRTRVGPPPAAGRPRVWWLTGPTGAELPGEATLASLGVLDGELLRLGPRTAPPPPPVFDDPVDAVAHADQLSPGTGSGALWTMGEWTATGSRTAASWVATAAVLGGSAALAASRGLSAAPSPAAIVAALATIAALGSAVWAARRGLAIAAGLGAAALPLAAVAAWAGLPGQPGAGQLLAACTITGAVAAVLLATVRTAVGPLVATISAAMLGGVALLVTSAVPLQAGTAVAGGGAAIAAVALALLPTLPRVAGRLAGLPVPVVPGSAAELVAAEHRPGVERPDELAARTLLAQRYLVGLIGGATAVAACGAVLAALPGGWAGPLFAGVTVAVLLLRTRAFVARAPVLVLLVGGLVTTGALATAAASTGGATALLVGLGLLGLAAGLAAMVGTGAVPTPSPVLRRALDVVGALLVATAFPLALAVLDVYRAVRQL